MGSTPKPIETGIVVGQVFLGKYRVDAILGHGGMGVVAQCTHLQLQDRVAIKMLRPDVLGDDDAVRRFMREAQAASKLKSEYVAKVTDVGAFENGVPYMVMEYLDGQDLGQLLGERKTLPVPWATELILQASEALSEAHALGIVHRDVKPTNLFVTWRPDGSALVKVLDFGISKSPMGSDMQLTQTQSLLGTPAYMSPEQMRSARLVDARSDIWSLGTVLYEVIEGRRPFEAESFSEMVVKVSVDSPLQMRNAPPALQPIILRCLAKAPEQRYPNMAELGRDLMPFSQDAHGAQIIVERMERMVRRAAGEWSETSTSAGARVPQQLRDLASRPHRLPTPVPGQAPLPPAGLPTPQPGRMVTPSPGQLFAADSQPAAPAWAGGSQPAAQPWAGGTDPAAASLAGYDAARMPPRAMARSVDHPTMLVSAPKKASRRALLGVIAVAALAGVAIGVGMAMSGDSRAPAQPTAPITAPAVDMKADLAPPPPVAADKAPPAAAPPAAIGSDTPPKPVAPLAAAPPPKPAAVKPHLAPPPPPAHPQVTQPPLPPPPHPTPRPSKPCDPFSSAHHC